MLKTSTSIDYENLPVGERVHYTGDRANEPGEGKIVASSRSEKWGQSYRLHLDDGRVFAIVTPAELHPQPGRRFRVMSEMRAETEAKVARMRAAMAARKAG